MFKSVFGDKTGGTRYQGVVSVRGSRAFEKNRAALGKLAGRDADTISDSDVIEFLSLGPIEAARIIEEEKTKGK